MGKNTVQFSCHHCNHCCTEVVCLPTPWDVIRIVRGTGQNPYEFLDWLTLDDIDEVSKNDPTWLECDGKRYIMALRRHGERCHFLDKKTRFCTIYEARPILCRLYPFRVAEYADGTFKGFVLHDNVGCPKHRDGVMQVKPLYELYVHDEENQENYNRLVRAFNRKKYPGKKPQDFIEMFITGLQRPAAGGRGNSKKLRKKETSRKAQSPLA